MIGTKYLKDVLSGPIKMVNNSNLSYEVILMLFKYEIFILIRLIY